MVSVIIPTYNRAKKIEASIKSVLEQTYSDLELIVVDDGSTDETELVVSKIKDERLRYVKCSVNSGVATARNTGIKEAKGDYIAFNDSDDLWKKNKLFVQMKLMEQKKDCHFVYCAFVRKSINGIEQRIPNNFIDQMEISGYIFEKLLQGNFISTQTIIFKKEILDQVGMFNTAIKAFDDYEFVMRVAKQYPIYYVNEELVEVEESDNSVSLKSNYINHYMDHINMLTQYWNKVDDNYKLFSMLNETCSYLGYMSKDELKKYGKMLMAFVGGDELAYIVIAKTQNSLLRYKYKEIMLQEITGLQDGIVRKYLNKKGINNIAIYGNGYVGKIVRKIILTESDCDCYMIDRKPQNESYKVYTMEETIPCVDLIVVSVFDKDSLVNKTVSKKYKAKVFSLEQWLRELKEDDTF